MVARTDLEERALVILKELQWLWDTSWGEYCQFCHGERPGPHDDGCQVAALIKDLEGA